MWHPRRAKPDDPDPDDDKDFTTLLGETLQQGLQGEEMSNADRFTVMANLTLESTKLEASAAQARALLRATYVLAFATIALVLATVVLVIVTL